MDIKKEIETTLRQTRREGIEDLLKYMDEAGFYTSPASTKYHGAAAGQLAVHSLNVCNAAIDVATAWCGENWVDNNINSIVICALLHDLGKAGQFNKPYYVDNVLKTGQSKAQPFKVNDELMTLDHELVSVIEASKYIKLTEDEQRAIAWHNGLYGLFKYQIAGKETPLYMIIHFADMWASRVMESDDIKIAKTVEAGDEDVFRNN
jgi:23S rRNA maturation-related 3'-5' exoribonuclease YhaM